MTQSEARVRKERAREDALGYLEARRISNVSTAYTTPEIKKTKPKWAKKSGKKAPKIVSRSIDPDLAEIMGTTPQESEISEGLPDVVIEEESPVPVPTKTTTRWMDTMMNKLKELPASQRRLRLTEPIQTNTWDDATLRAKLGIPPAVRMEPVPESLRNTWDDATLREKLGIPPPVRMEPVPESLTYGTIAEQVAKETNTAFNLPAGNTLVPAQIQDAIERELDARKLGDVPDQV